MSARTRPKSQTKTRTRRGVGRPGDGDDVRGAILAAALRQLEATGSPERVTVAAIIDEAGCTPPSLYHYWPKRELLLQEASALGWAQFRASQAGAVADRQDLAPDTGQGSNERRDPVEGLRSRGRAYLDFALARPSLFRVLFLEPAAAGPGEPPAPTATTGRPLGNSLATGQALNDLVTDVTQAMAAGQLRPADPLTTALALWSAMHGVAALWAVTPRLPTDLAHAVGDLAQDAVLAGLAS